MLNELFYSLELRDRPFNLQGRGGYGVLIRSEICFRTTRELEYLFCLPHKINILTLVLSENKFLYETIFFPQNLTLGYMTKSLDQVFFFASTKIRIFFSATLGIKILF
jgi:hypothetical protein